MALTLRRDKGSPLTHEEMDNNLAGLADGSLLDPTSQIVIALADASDEHLVLTRTDSPQSWGIRLDSNDFNIRDLTYTGSPIYLSIPNASGGAKINVNSGGNVLDMSRLDNGQRWIVHFAENAFTIREEVVEKNFFSITNSTGRVNLGEIDAGEIPDLNAKLGVAGSNAALDVVRLKAASAQTGHMLRVVDSSDAVMTVISASGRIMVGTVEATGSNASDLITKNTGAFRFIRAGVSTSANYGIQSDAADEMNLMVPGAGDAFNFQFTGTTSLKIERENAGPGILFSAESTADKSAPAANQAIVYTKDDGSGATVLAARFNSGDVQILGVQGLTTQTYTVTNVTTDRAYDANATTTDELADVLGTLIADLRARKLIA